MKPKVELEGAEASALPQLQKEKEKDLARIGELDVEPSPQHAATNGKRSMPQRIQRKRTKGWRMPEGVVYVGRGTQWGNPFKLGTPNADDCMRGYRDEIVAKYRYEIVCMNGGFVGFNRFWVQQHLRGKDLACWCPLDQPCHADVLLELANAPDEAQGGEHGNA